MIDSCRPTETDGAVEISDQQFDLVQSQGARAEHAERNRQQDPVQDKYMQV